MRKPRVLRRGCTGIGLSEAETVIRRSTASTSWSRGTPRVYYAFVLVHRGEARADAGVGVRAVYEGRREAAESRMRRATAESQKRRAAAEMRYRPSTSLICHSCQSTEATFGPTAESIGMRSSGSTGATLGPMASACEHLSMQRKEIGGGVAEDDDDESGDEIDRDDDGDGGGDIDGDDD
ncbi:hypothetical protein Scep_028391 [Stephania cephalantha]|uniref:Uncharacterized protein n=1 Tax=Stephania cephalantha TaxID=152367 RepID=A0AAP0HJJ2_9MAGN